MQRLRTLLVDLIIIATICATIFFLYKMYTPILIGYLFGDQTVGILIRDVSVDVSIADEPEERQKGLSDVTSLAPNSGKLFIFDTEGKYGFWMKDTKIPLDIIWIDNDLKIVHIAKNVRPDSYPTIYNSPVPARLVLEVNAHFTNTFRINVGDKVTVPANRLPEDLQ